VLMKHKCDVAVSNCLYWYSLSVLYERTVHKSGARQYVKEQIICLIVFRSIYPWVSNIVMVKDSSHYCGLVHRPHKEK